MVLIIRELLSGRIGCTVSFLIEQISEIVK